VIDIQADLIGQPGADGAGTTGYLGIGPVIEVESVGVLEGIGIAGQTVWNAIRLTFESLGQLIRPSNLVRYLGVFVGNTDVGPEIRPVSPIGIVNLGTQAQSVGSFLAVLALVNVALASINLLPLFPLDGGHFAVALYEKVTRREANVQRLMPVAVAVVGLFLFLGFVGIILDIVNPISL
jgi:membrane-associated protease RseP (regulator of RpoE activity)